MVKPPRRPALADESGMSLVEMMISIGVFSLVMTFTFTAVTSAWRAQRGIERRQANLTEARTIMNNLTKDVRTATRLTPTTSPFTIGNDFEIQFCANLHPTSGPKLLHLYVDAGDKLVQRIRSGCSSGSWAAPRDLGTSVVDTDVAPLFEYYDASGASLSTPLSTSGKLNVDAVGIRLSIKAPTNLQVKPTTLVGRVRLPNVYYNPLTTT